MSRNYVPAVALAAALLLTGQGCITIGGGGQANSNADGGVFKTSNRGDAWAQKVGVNTAGEKRTIAAANVVAFAQDPQDANAVYVGTGDNGLLYSYDGGESWNVTAQINRGRVPSVAVNPSDKCMVYAAIDNKLLVTKDCSRTWEITYVDARADKKITSVAADFFNPKVLWVATNAGDVIKSLDGGSSWATAKTFDNPVQKLVMSPTDSRRVYAGTKSGGLWRTDDGGATWKNLSDNYKTFSGAKEFNDVAIAQSDANTVILASKYGLLRSVDAGEKWEAVPLLTPPGTTLIYSVAIDPKDASVFYYGTATTFYRTVNGGVNWVPKKLPTSRVATAILVDRANPAVLYMGVTKFK